MNNLAFGCDGDNEDSISQVETLEKNSERLRMDDQFISYFYPIIPT